MKKGLKQTLMTVAVAVLGMQAWAEAPVIGNIPSPVVGDDGQATEPNRFVFPDAIDLDQMATDDNVANTDIKWAFYIENSKYKVNGADSLTLAETTAATAPAGKEIARQVLGGELNPDGKTNTITIRNNDLSPLGASGTKTPAAGVQDIQTVTFFASDGTTSSLKDGVFFYTENGGADRMSGGPVDAFESVAKYDFSTGAQGWASSSTFGSVSFGTTGGLTMNIPMAGDNMAAWQSNWPAFQLTAGSVYQIRLKMNFTQAQSGANVPFWDLVLDNLSNDGSKGKNLFGADFMVLDMPSENSAYAIPNTQSGTDYTFYWAPNAVESSAWTAGAFAAAMDADNDVRLTLRTMDVTSNQAVSGASDGGVITMSELEVSKAPISSVKVVSNLKTISSFSSSNYSLTSYTSMAPVWNSDGSVTYNPNSSTAASDLVDTFPGDSNANPADPSTIPDNYVIPWTAGKVYRLSFELKAPTAADVTNSPDFYFVSFDSPTQEASMDTFTTNNQGAIGMPQTTAANFTTYYSTLSGTKSNEARYKFLRPRFSIGNNGNFVNGNNTGKVTISKMAVDEVEFQ